MNKLLTSFSILFCIFAKFSIASDEISNALFNARIIEALDERVKSQTIISGPIGSWIKILKIQSYLENKDYCLLYQAKYKKQKPILALKNWPCLTSNPVIESVEFPRNISIKVQGKILIINDGIKKSHYPIPNLFLLNNQRLQRREFSVIKLKDKEKIQKREKLSLKEGDLCHSFNNTCKEIQSNQCFRCPGKWQYIAGNGCDSQYDKICHDEKCGQKNSPACLRGHYWKPGLSNECGADVSTVYCDKGFVPYCKKGTGFICL